MYTDYLRRTAAICLLALSGSFTAPASAEDWHSRWQAVMDEPVPEDIFEAQDILWTYVAVSGRTLPSPTA